MSLPPFLPRAQRAGRISPWREIACRSCGRWISHASGAWLHVHDASPACSDPDLRTQPQQEESN